LRHRGKREIAAGREQYDPAQHHRHAYKVWPVFHSVDPHLRWDGYSREEPMDSDTAHVKRATPPIVN
jgi:hypothetical protein